MDLFRLDGFQKAIAELERDLREEGGPQISTMRNYTFALLVYRPDYEFRARRHVMRMVQNLEGEGWRVLSIDLSKVLLDRVRAAGENFIATTVRMEKRNAKSPERAKNVLTEKMTIAVGGEAGLAEEISRQVRAFIDAHPEDAGRTLVLLGRAGALYPWFRVSALLKEMGSRIHKVPVVILYPGERHGAALSFMGENEPDADYRPRIYA